MVFNFTRVVQHERQRQGRRSEVEDDAVQPTRGVGLIEVRPDISRRAVSWLLTTPGAGLAPGLRPFGPSKHRWWCSVRREPFRCQRWSTANRRRWHLWAM